MEIPKYTLQELWRDLETGFNTFNDKPHPACNEEDEKAYQHANETIAEMIRLGREAENLSYYTQGLKKASIGMRLKNLFFEKFGELRTPPVAGKKSLAFLKDVVLPFQDNVQKIEHEWWLKILSRLVFINLDDEMAMSKILSARYREVIALKEGKCSELGIFAEAKNTTGCVEAIRPSMP